MLISNSERTLIMLIQGIQFGELYDVMVPQEKPSIEVGLQNGNRKLIKYLREHPEVQTIQVHCGEAKQIEVTGEKDKIRYRQKIRF